MTATSASPVHPSNAEQTSDGVVFAAAWQNELADAGRRGHFFWTVTMFAVASCRL